MLFEKPHSCLSSLAGEKTYFKDIKPGKIRKSKWQIKYCQRADEETVKYFTTNVKFLMKRLQLQRLGTKQRHKSIGSDNKKRWCVNWPGPGYKWEEKKETRVNWKEKETQIKSKEFRESK